jgi:hypothetical protein
MPGPGLEETEKETSPEGKGQLASWGGSPDPQPTPSSASSEVSICGSTGPGGPPAADVCRCSKATTILTRMVLTRMVLTDGSHGW